jgi:hypothetical protein
MIQELIENNFLIVREFIDIQKAKNLSKEFVEYCEKNNTQDDPQIPNTPAKYNYISFLELLCEKTPEVSDIIGETVLPTYCYSRTYKTGDVLTKHTDRDACEISLTLHLDGDKDWEIYVQTPSGKEVPVKLRSGDALVYMGCDASHWRNEYEGSYYSQVFMHYVRSRGERSYAYFDNKDKKIFEKNLKFLNDIRTSNMKSEEIGLYKIKSTSKVEDFITIYENIIPEDLCDRILQQYKNDPEWEPAQILGGAVDISSRNCKLINISKSDIISKNHFIRKKIDDDIFEIASKIIDNIRSKFQTLVISQDTGYTLLEYDTGGFYTQHTDSYTTEPRAISCSLCLNDDYEGGEFAFFDRELKYKLKKGSAITFPSNHMFPHEIMPVTEGVRYSIITWFI